MHEVFSRGIVIVLYEKITFSCCSCGSRAGLPSGWGPLRIWLRPAVAHPGSGYNCQSAGVPGASLRRASTRLRYGAGVFGAGLCSACGLRASSFGLSRLRLLWRWLLWRWLVCALPLLRRLWTRGLPRWLLRSWELWRAWTHQLCTWVLSWGAPVTTRVDRFGTKAETRVSAFFVKVATNPSRPIPSCLAGEFR